MALLALSRPSFLLHTKLTHPLVSHKPSYETAILEMFLLHQSLVLLLIFITSCLGVPVNRRQSNLTSLADCATAALQIDQFITFTGSTTQNPHISFYLTNPNAGAPGKMLCTATLASNEGSFNGSEFYSCEVRKDLHIKA